MRTRIGRVSRSSEISRKWTVIVEGAAYPPDEVFISAVVMGVADEAQSVLGDTMVVGTPGVFERTPDQPDVD